MHKTTAILLLLVTAVLAYPQNKDIDRIIEKKFGGPLLLARNTTDTTEKNTKDNTDKPTVDNTDKNTDANEPCNKLNIAAVCTPYYMCKNDIISKDRGGIDLANGEDQYYCASYLDVCCTREKTTDKVDGERQ